VASGGVKFGAASGVDLDLGILIASETRMVPVCPLIGICDHAGPQTPALLPSASVGVLVLRFLPVSKWQLISHGLAWVEPKPQSLRGVARILWLLCKAREASSKRRPAAEGVGSCHCWTGAWFSPSWPQRWALTGFPLYMQVLQSVLMKFPSRVLKPPSHVVLWQVSCGLTQRVQTLRAASLSRMSGSRP